MTFQATVTSGQGNMPGNRWIGIRTVVVAFALLSAGAPLGPSTANASTDGLLVVPPLTVGDEAVYEAVSFFPNASVDLVLQVEGTAPTRDGFEVVHEDAVRVLEEYVGSDGETDRTRRALDSTTATELWSEIPSDWIRRDYEQWGSPWAFGASVLSGRSFGDGDTYTFSLWDGLLDHELTFTIHRETGPDAPGPWRVEISDVGISVGTHPASVTEFVPGGTLWFDDATPYPVQVDVPDHRGGFTLHRTSSSQGDGPTFEALELPEPPWDRNPRYGFLELQDPLGPPPEHVPGEVYDERQLAELVEFADENAPGLAAFREEHETVGFRSALFGSRGVGTSEIGNEALGIPEQEWRRNEDRKWTLKYRAGEENAGWEVTIALERFYLLGEEIYERMYVANEEASERPSPFGADPAPGEHAELSGVLAGAWETHEEDELFSWSVMRTTGPRPWTSETRYWYVSLYVPQDPGLAEFLKAIIVNSRDGTIEEIQGPAEFLASYDEKGYAAPG